MSETNKAPDKISLLPDHEHGYVWIDGWASSEDEAECYLHVSQYNTKAEEIQRLRDAASGLSNLLTKRNEEIHRLRNTLKRVMHWQSSLTLPASIKEEAENLLLEQEE